MKISEQNLDLAKNLMAGHISAPLAIASAAQTYNQTGVYTVSDKLSVAADVMGALDDLHGQS